MPKQPVQRDDCFSYCAKVRKAKGLNLVLAWSIMWTFVATLPAVFDGSVVSPVLTSSMEMSYLVYFHVDSQ